MSLLSGLKKATAQLSSPFSPSVSDIEALRQPSSTAVEDTRNELLSWHLESSTTDNIASNF